MNPLIVLLVFAIMLIAELPDKTMFASLMLSTRFGARWVFLGAAAAFLIHVIIAAAAGSLLTLLPHRVLQFVVAALFLAGASFMLRASRSEEEDQDEIAAVGAGNRTVRTAITASFAVIFIGEWGDITQIATANLAAKYHSPIAVGLGAVLGLWCAELIAVTAGRGLLRVVSVTLLLRVGAAIFLGFGAYSLFQAVR